MSWKVLTGDQSDVYAAVLWARLRQEGYEPTTEAASRCLRAHIHRGLNYLASGYNTKSVTDFATRWL